MAQFPLNPDCVRRNTIVFLKPLDWQDDPCLANRRVHFDALSPEALRQLIAAQFLDGHAVFFHGTSAHTLLDVAQR